MDVPHPSKMAGTSTSEGRRIILLPYDTLPVFSITGFAFARRAMIEGEIRN